MKKALVVDDTKNIRNLLSTCLELNGYEVIGCKNAMEALNVLKNRDIDIAFLDIKMPEISGTELLKHMRSLGINTPVIIMTAFATIKNAVDCTKLGAVAYIQKPFTANKIKSVLNEVWSSIDNKDIEIKENMALSEELIKIGNLDDALSILKNTLSLNPSSGNVYRLMGKVYQLKGDKEKSKIFYSIAEEFIP